jgi:hypothetical protein
MAINGHLITDETRYKTEIIQYPIVVARINQQRGGGYSYHGLSNEEKKLYTSISLTSPINSEVLRESYYDTVTNVSIDDITMRMQGQTVECYAYSFVNWNSNGNSPNGNNLRYLMHYSGRIGSSPHSNVQSNKAMIQVDCEYRE